MAAQAQAKPESDDKEPIPSLTFSVLTKEAEKQDAMRLVTDSIAQQRQVASFSVIVHPACLTALVAGCGCASILYRLSAERDERDFGTALIMMCGLAIAYLAAVRLLTANYIRLAENFKWKQWVANPDGNDDHVLAARFGDEIIATVVLRIKAPAASASASAKKTETGPSSFKGGSGVIRAWTTRYRYRNKGIGGDMLRLAVLATRSKCGDDAPVTFDPEHANSARPLPAMFNRPFIKRAERASVALEHAVAACDRKESVFQAD